MDLPPPNKETKETFPSPDETLFQKPLPILKDAQELDVFTRHTPKQDDIDKFLRILKAKVAKSYDLPLTAIELQKEYTHFPAFKAIYKFITQGSLPSDK